jgi:hypothetical protein
MPTPPLSDALALEAAEAFRTHGTKGEAARALGLDRATYRNRLNHAAKRGMLGFSSILPGFEVKQTAAQIDGVWVQQRPEPGEEFETPAGHVVKGVSALVDETGRVRQQWIKTRQDQYDLETTLAAIKEAFEGYVPSAPLREAPAESHPDLLTLYPLADWHLGMYAWQQETGENWDLKLGEKKIGEAMHDLVSRSPQSATGIVLGGGDLIHSDNQQNRTARSGNALDVDGRYPKVVGVACRLIANTVELVLQRHESVVVRILPGNHDEHTSVAVAYHAAAWFRNEPRVTVDLDPSLFWWHRFGKCFLGATHGHTIKLRDMPLLMASRRAEDWGKSKFRYVHGFHIHHKEMTATESKGVITESHQAPIPKDAWHFGAGYEAARSVSSITYHREDGECGRSRVVVR